MREAKFDRPAVQHSASGVLHVKSADILMSKVGRHEIDKAAGVAVSRHIRKDGGVKDGRSKSK